MNKLVLIVFAASSIVFAQKENDSLSVKNDTTQNGLVSTSEVKVDSLQCKANGDSISEHYKDSLLLDSLKHKRHAYDTIDAIVLANQLSGEKTSFTTRLSKARAQGYGGGAILCPMALGLRMKPINELVEHDQVLKKYSFPDLDDGYKPLLVMGVFPYGGVGNGMRIGLGGWGGDIFFNSENYNDSTMLLHVHLSYFAIMMEKAFVKNNWNYLVGGMVGMGKFTVKRSTARNSWQRDGDDNDESIDASYGGFEMHSGFTVTLLPWMHIGLDVNGTFMLSVNGFNISGCNGFTSVAPGLRLRIVLGNLG